MTQNRPLDPGQPAKPARRWLRKELLAFIVIAVLLAVAVVIDLVARGTAVRTLYQLP